jgi:hypothetical protein
LGKKLKIYIHTSQIQKHTNTETHKHRNTQTQRTQTHKHRHRNTETYPSDTNILHSLDTWPGSHPETLNHHNNYSIQPDSFYQWGTEKMGVLSGDTRLLSVLVGGGGQTVMVGERKMSPNELGAFAVA